MLTVCKMILKHKQGENTIKRNPHYPSSSFSSCQHFRINFDLDRREHEDSEVPILISWGKKQGKYDGQGGEKGGDGPGHTCLSPS